MKNTLLIVIIAIIACISMVVYSNRYNNMTSQGIRAINMQVDACTIDMQHDNNIICD